MLIETQLIPGISDFKSLHETTKIYLDTDLQIWDGEQESTRKQSAW